LHRESLLAYFSFISGDSHIKDQALQDFCRRFNFGPEEVLFVGDLISDIRDGKKVGCITVACTKWLSPESMPPAVRPDAHITELIDLFSVLGVNPTLRS
jgi:phosphoglycolate phosphatase-like HAD superfamily hydrolase